MEAVLYEASYFKFPWHSSHSEFTFLYLSFEIIDSNKLNRNDNDPELNVTSLGTRICSVEQFQVQRQQI